MPTFLNQDLNVDTVNTTGDVEIEGNLTVSGTTTTVSTTNTVVSDKLIELGNGTSGSPSGDAGIIIERGSSNNAAIIWDESADTFVVGTTTATGASTGDLSVTDAALKTAAITASGDISTTGEVKTAKVSFTDGDDAITIADGGGITANTSLTLASGATVTAINDEDNMSSNSATALATQQSIKAYVDSQTSGSGNMDNWILEDDDGTEVTVSNGKEVKFIGSGITTNFTDVSDGSDADPFDLTFTVDAAQTGITSILATDLKIGEDDQTKIDFETADQINFYANNAKRVTIDSSGLTIDSGSLETATIDYTDGDLAITIADGGGITAAAGITSTAAANTLGATSFNDANITNVGDIALDSISADGTDINVAVSDNSATALTIKQGSDAYLIVDTANSSESVAIGTGVSGTAVSIGHTTSETTVNDNLTVTGNLTVNGTTTTINSTTLTVDDKTVVIASGASDSAAADGAGISIDGASATLTYAHSGTKFVTNKSLDVTGTLTATNLAGTLTTAAQTNITSVGTLTALTVDDVAIDGKVITMTGSSGDTATLTAGADGTLVIATTDATAEGADLTLDIDGDIVLDSAEGKWRLKKDGSTKLKIDHGNAGDITIENGTQDKDIIFKGDDGGYVITALTLDMSEAGAATFNNKVVATELDISGDADIDGTLEADAITVDGTNLLTGGVITSLGTITQDTVTFTSANALDPLLIIKNTTNDADAARLRFVKDKGAAGADADGSGEIEFYADDDNQDNILFAKIRAEVADASNGAEGGRIMMGVATHDGEFQNGLVIEDGSEEDEIDVIIGNGINSVVTANGYSKALNGFLVPEQKSVHIETPMLATADHTATGITALLTASENLAIGDLVYVSGNGTVGKADADSVAKMPAIGLAVEAINANNPGPILLQGMFRDDTFNFTAGNRLFASTTDGGITATVPSGSNDVAQAVGVALSDDVIYFKPDMTLVEIS